jgi:hypothetical protein
MTFVEENFRKWSSIPVEYANKWSIAEFLTLFSRNVNVNKCEKTCVEYIKKFKVSNLNSKQITRLFAIYISFIFWILETFKIGNTCKSNNLDLSIQISIYILSFVTEVNSVYDTLFLINSTLSIPVALIVQVVLFFCFIKMFIAVINTTLPLFHFRILISY